MDSQKPLTIDDIEKLFDKKFDAIDKKFDNLEKEIKIIKLSQEIIKYSGSDTISTTLESFSTASLLGEPIFVSSYDKF